MSATPRCEPPAADLGLVTPPEVICTQLVMTPSVPKGGAAGNCGQAAADSEPLPTAQLPEDAAKINHDESIMTATAAVGVPESVPEEPVFTGLERQELAALPEAQDTSENISVGATEVPLGKEATVTMLEAESTTTALPDTQGQPAQAPPSPTTTLRFEREHIHEPLVTNLGNRMHVRVGC